MADAENLPRHSLNTAPVLASHSSLARRLEALEKSVTALDANTRQEFVRVYKAILKLMGPAPPVRHKSLQSRFSVIAR